MLFFFFFNDTATTEIYTLSLHDALPILIPSKSNQRRQPDFDRAAYRRRNAVERLINRLKQFRRIATRYEKRAANYLAMVHIRSEEHTSELQSRQYLVCRLLLEKKNKPHSGV